MATGRTVRLHVDVQDVKAGVNRHFSPGDEVPAHLAAIIDADVWTKPEADQDPDEDPGGADPDEDPNAGDTDEDPDQDPDGVDEDPDGDSDEDPDADPDEGDPEPPRSGPGSSKAAWAAYADANGITIPDDADRDGIIAAVDASR